jgi:hypothetical protein
VIGVSKAFELLEIEVGKLWMNPWNPNGMSDEIYHKLKAYIEREG